MFIFDVNKCNNTCLTNIEMKSIDVKPSSHAEHNVAFNAKDSVFKISDNVRISK